MTDFLVKILYEAKYDCLDYNEEDEESCIDVFQDVIKIAEDSEYLTISPTAGRNSYTLFSNIIKANRKIDKYYEDYKLSLGSPFEGDIRERIGAEIKRLNKCILSYLEAYYYFVVCPEILEEEFPELEDKLTGFELVKISEQIIPKSFWSQYDFNYPDGDYISHLQEIRDSYKELATLIVSKGSILKLFNSLDNKEGALIKVRDYLLDHDFSLNGTYFAGTNEVLLPREIISSFLKVFTGTKISGNLVSLNSYRLWDINKELQNLIFNPSASLV